MSGNASLSKSLTYPLKPSLINAFTASRGGLITAFYDKNHAKENPVTVNSGGILKRYSEIFIYPLECANATLCKGG